MESTVEGELASDEAPLVVIGASVEAPVEEDVSEREGGGVSRASGRRRKRRRLRDEEEEDEEAEIEIEPDPDIEEDCAVYGDDDFDAVDDDIGGEDNGGLAVEDNVAIESDFPDASRGNEDETDDDSGDDIWEDDKIPDPLSSEDEDENGVGRERARRDAENPEVLLAMDKTFNTPEDFKLALLMYSLKTRYDICLYRSEALIVAARCSYVGADGVRCGWRVYCSYEKSKHKMIIRAYANEHHCVRSGYTKMLKRSSIALLFEERLRVNPKLTKNEMVAEIKREYKLEVTPDQCAKAKTKVLKARYATHDEHFSRIWDYQAEVIKENPGSEFEIETVAGTFIGSKQRFYRCYICFKSQKESWIRTCRPVIGIDRAFLKWDIKGHLLAAVGRDGDNRIVPLAWAVVEIENDDNWDWFLRQLAASLGLCEMEHLAIISDKQSVSVIKKLYAFDSVLIVFCCEQVL